MTSRSDLRAKQKYLSALNKQGRSQGWSSDQRRSARDQAVRGTVDDGYSITPEMRAFGDAVMRQFYGGMGGGGGGYSRGGYYRGGGGGGGVDYAKLKQQLADLKAQGRSGVENVSNEAIMRLAGIQAQAKERNTQLLAQVGNPYQSALSQANGMWGGMMQDAGRWGSPTAGLAGEIDARRLAMQDSEARQRSLMGQIGSQMETSLAQRQASAAQAKANALSDLEKLYTVAMQKLGG